jgi:N-acetylmuramoyl-L-alanine amidase
VELAAAGIGPWPKPGEPGEGAEVLSRYGYDPQAPLEKRIIAFQRHFRPENLTGTWDDECSRRLAGLLLVKTYPTVL